MITCLVNTKVSLQGKCIHIWIILLNLVHTRYLQFLAIFHNLAGNQYDLLPKTSKALINTLKQLRFVLILLDLPCFSYIFSLLGVRTVTKKT